MPSLSLASWILVVVVALFTAIAAIWDYRQHRIPNKLTLPVFALGPDLSGRFSRLAGAGKMRWAVSGRLRSAVRTLDCRGRRAAVT